MTEKGSTLPAYLARCPTRPPWESRTKDDDEVEDHVRAGARCPPCNGTGWKSGRRHNVALSGTPGAGCPACHGTGLVDEDCGGTERVTPFVEPAGGLCVLAFDWAPWLRVVQLASESCQPARPWHGIGEFFGPDCPEVTRSWCSGVARRKRAKVSPFVGDSEETSDQRRRCQLCPTCFGSQYLTSLDGTPDPDGSTACPDCDGSGWVDENCKGDGLVAVAMLCGWISGGYCADPWRAFRYVQSGEWIDTRSPDFDAGACLPAGFDPFARFVRVP